MPCSRCHWANCGGGVDLLSFGHGRSSSDRGRLRRDRSSRSGDARGTKREGSSVRVDEGVVAKARSVFGSASSMVGQVLGTASVESGLAISLRGALLELELARECRSASHKGNSGEGGAEVHLNYRYLVGCAVEMLL